MSVFEQVFCSMHLPVTLETKSRIEFVSVILFFNNIGDLSRKIKIYRLTFLVNPLITQNRIILLLSIINLL